jgi:hypothetical protein
MTRIVSGYAQPDIVATRDNKKGLVFVETPQSFKNNIETLVMTIRELALDRLADYKLANLKNIRIEFAEDEK